MEALPRTVAKVNAFRGPPDRLVSARAPYKEWYHFCVVAQGRRLLVNFSVAERGERMIGRVILMWHDPGGWRGSLGESEVALDDIGRWLLSFEVDRSALSFRSDGVFEIDVTLDQPRVEASIELRPAAVPLVGLGSSFGDGELSWVVVPRLAATGTLTTEQGTWRFDRAIAYHDHNWGTWRWGSDLSWQWGFLLPADEHLSYSIVWSRLTDRARARAFDAKLCLWEGGALRRVLGERDVAVRGRRGPRRDRLLKLPPVMGLLSPGTGTDVPASLSFEGSRGDTRVTMEVELGDVAQVLVPNEVDLATTAIHEVAASARVTLVDRDRTTPFEAHGVFEILTVA